MTQPDPNPSYYAVALQSSCRSVDGLGVEDAQSAILEAIGKIDRQIAATKRFTGADLSLIVLPEYVLTSYPWNSTPAEWREKAALNPDGAAMAALQSVAEKNSVFLAANLYERDANFPKLYFQSNLIFSPAGDIILRYRRLISMFAPSPYDVLERYIDLYGEDAFFPVVDTEIGRLGTIASEEILYPEIARALAFKGAEILVHPTSEIGSPDPTPKDISKFARAVENMAYLVSSNTAEISDSDVPSASTDAMSKIINYKGLSLAHAGAGESMAAYAEIDVGALRRYRARPGMGHLLSRQPVEVYKKSYANAKGAVANELGDGSDDIDKGYFATRQKKVIEALFNAGLL